MPRPPGSLDTTDELAAVRAEQRRAARGRDSQPLCVATLTTTQNITAGANYTAGPGWIATSGLDTWNMLKTGNPCYVEIPVPGRYHVRLHTITSALNCDVACKVMKNGTNVVVNSVISDNRRAPNSGGEGAHCHAERDLSLVTGDKLYWGAWCSATYQVSPSSFGGLLTEITVRRLGPIP